MPHIPRTLSYSDEAERTQTISESGLLSLKRPLVILGEPGMGKTVLTKWLGEQEGMRYITAKQFVRKSNPADLVATGETLVIDALDEVAAAKEGDPVHHVLSKLDQANTPLFILSCRVADWQGATARTEIADDYDCMPLELRLEPLSRHEALAFLQFEPSTKLSEADAERVLKHLETQGLDVLFGNPLTLGLVGEVAASGKTLPESRADLLTKVCDQLRLEKNQQRKQSALRMLNQEQALDAAGAICAALLLAEKDAVLLLPPDVESDDAISLSDIADLPHAEHVREIIRSRLFTSPGEERFAPIHRVISEFLGARWLARTLGGRVSTRRFFAMIIREERIPASLRGLIAWLAYHRPALASEIIHIDPYGLVLYGDTQSLPTKTARALLQAVKETAARDPYFRSKTWDSSLSAKGLAREELWPEIMVMLSTRDRSGFQLRELLLQALKGVRLTAKMADFLKNMVFDTTLAYAERSDAVKVLLKSNLSLDLHEIVVALCKMNDDDSPRLGFNMIINAKFAGFDDRLVADTVCVDFGIGIDDDEKVARRANKISSAIYHISYDYPKDRIATLLDQLALVLDGQLRSAPWELRHQVSDLVMRLIDRELENGDPEWRQLWKWLSITPNDPYRNINEYQNTQSHLKHNISVRRNIQQHILFDAFDTNEIRTKYDEICVRHPILALTEDDVLYFLSRLAAIGPPNLKKVETWKLLVNSAIRREGMLQQLQDAAMKFAQGDPELESYLRKYSKPIIHKCDIEQKAREAQKLAEHDARNAQDRQKFAANIEQIRAGESNWLILLSKVYCGWYTDLDKKLKPSERILAWLGPNLTGAALNGFEAILHRNDCPVPLEIATHHADHNTTLPVIFPFLIGLAEHHKTSLSFEDIQSDVIFLGLLGLEYHSSLEYNLQHPGLKKALEIELQLRPGDCERYWRLLIEPQLRSDRDHVTGLNQIFHEPHLRSIALPLTAEWLDHFSDISHHIQSELIDFLLGDLAYYPLLAKLAHIRINEPEAWDLTSMTWMSVGLLVNFGQFQPMLQGIANTHRKFIWHVRERMVLCSRNTDERMGLVHGMITPEQRAWIVREFRSAWPYESYRTEIWVGNATSFIKTLINQLAANSSDEAANALRQLSDETTDSYTEYILHAVASQKQLRCESSFQPVSLRQLKAVVDNKPPETIHDLQAFVLDVLDVVQKRLKGSDTNPIATVWDNEKPKGEEYCRDRVVEWMEPHLPEGSTRHPEARMPNEKRSDIAVAVGDLQLPVEIKGQWHKDVWEAMNTQLDARYTTEWRSRGRGIYIVLWFGKDERLKPHPDGQSKPTTPDALRDMLIERIPEHRRGQLAVVVLDLSR